jgi:methyl-accepting chemotaxis protein
MFRTMTIGKKLFSSIGAALAVALIIAGTTIFSLSRVTSNLDQIVNGDAKRQVLANAINLDITEMISTMRALNLRAAMHDQAFVDTYHRQYQNEIADLNRNVSELETLVQTPVGQAYVTAMRNGSSQMAEYNERVYQNALHDDMKASIAIFMNEFAPFANQLRGQSEQYAKRQTTSMTESVQSVKSIAMQTLTMTLTMLVLGGVIGVVVFFIVRKVTQDLRLAASSLSAGADQIASVATQTASTSQSLAQGASTLAS